MLQKRKQQCKKTDDAFDAGKRRKRSEKWRWGRKRVSRGQRCGLIAIVGKPNVGKSTLLNALVGQKISITSRKAQTTRHRITGIATRGATQFVFVDTPGFQTLHNTALNKSLNKTVMGAVGDVDLVLFVVEAGSFTPADARVLACSSPACHAADCQQARHGASPRRDRALAASPCRSATRLQSLCPCRPRTPKTSSACSESAKNTCPSSRGGMARTS
jgi:hypothetical protein